VSGLVALLRRGGAPVDAALLGRMTAGQRFRGPDGEGIWRAGSVGLGHTLHKTTLEAEREESPASLDGRLFIAADARIDARDELCARLRDCGHDLRTDEPDPVLILHAYDAWGEGCLPRLLGDFSFALWDAPRRKLVCAVDPLGVKPFYYADRGGLFAGGNSLDCVRLHPEVRDDLNEVAVGDFLLCGGYQDRDITIYADVARIPPGHLLVADEGGVRLRRYFSWPQPAEVSWRRPADCLERFEELLGCAVRDRLRTPKVAIFMSGGVDSPLVAMTAKRELERRFASPELVAYTSVCGPPFADDEAHYAGLVARCLSIPLDVQAFDAGALFDWSERICPAEPLARVVMGPYLDQLSRLAGRFTTALTGFDGDALLGAAVRKHWGERLSQGRLGDLARDLAWYLRTVRALPPIGVRTYLTRLRRGTDEPHRPGWLREGFWRRAALEQRSASTARPASVTHSREPSLRTFASPAWGGLFDSYDPGCLGRAIEVRHPLADLRLVRFALGLPAVPWCVDKHLLRRCLGGLPEAVRSRPKTPLVVDFDAELFRRVDPRALRVPWQSEGLAPFLDVAAMKRALDESPARAAPSWPLLRALGLGVWLNGRGSSELARPAPRRGVAADPCAQDDTGTSLATTPGAQSGARC
jgi:asparagine synthase (glutamine-hydrolysing)